MEVFSQWGKTQNRLFPTFEERKGFYMHEVFYSEEKIYVRSFLVTFLGLKIQTVFPLFLMLLKIRVRLFSLIGRRVLLISLDILPVELICCNFYRANDQVISGATHIWLFFHLYCWQWSTKYFLTRILFGIFFSFVGLLFLFLVLC